MSDSKLVLPDQMTYGEAYGPAMKMTTVAEAQEWLAALIERDMRCGYSETVEEAKALEMANLGYVAGYYDPDTRVRVNQLFGAEHPIFGGAYIVSASEAIEAGKKLANK